MIDQLYRDLLHALAWMIWNSHRRHLYRPEIDAGALTLEPHVPNGAGFQSLLEEDEQYAVEILGALDLLVCGEQQYDGTFACKFIFPAVSLRDALSTMPISSLVTENKLLSAFLTLASTFGDRFTSSRDGRQAVASLPIVQTSFMVPKHFAVYIEKLIACKYCERKGKQHFWTAKIRPHMETAGLWVGSKTRDELRKDYLKNVWETMPLNIKGLLTDDRDNLDVISFAFLLGHFFIDNETWEVTPENRKSAETGILKGGCISIARELGALFKSGEVRF